MATIKELEAKVGEILYSAIPVYRVAEDRQVYERTIKGGNFGPTLDYSDGCRVEVLDITPIETTVRFIDDYVPKSSTSIPINPKFGSKSGEVSTIHSGFVGYFRKESE